MNELITDEWLKEIGFRWHQFDRQPNKQWLLWLGSALQEPGGWRFTSFEDLGIELAPNDTDYSRKCYFCWLRSDAAGRYHRFLHVRYLVYQHELVEIISALVGVPFEPSNVINGCLHTPQQAESLRRDSDRLDQRILAENWKWADVEKDDSRGRALPEHMDAAVKNGGAK